MTETPQQLTCLRCDHTWTPRKRDRPACCPNCKQTKWDTPSRFGRKAEATKDR